MKILNFGSLNIDFVYSVDHFVRPGETISSEKLEKFCGGKGLNQSIALANAGAEVYHCGKISSSGDGDFLVNALEKSGCDIKYILKSETPSGHAIIQVDKSGQNCIMLFGGANQTFTKDEIISVLDNFDNGDMILLQNEINEIDFIINEAKNRGLIIALNPSPITNSLLSCSLDKVDYFILNEIEGCEISGKADKQDVANSLLEKYPNCKVVLTLGKKGVLYKDNDVCFNHGIYNVQVVDTTAAGDTFTGFFLACIARNFEIPKALEYASIASSIAVSRMGASVSIPSFDEVETTNLKPCEDKSLTASL